MTLKEAALLAREVLSPEATLADAVYNADVHSLSLFNYSELNDELEQLYHQYSREADKLQSVDKISEDTLQYISLNLSLNLSVISSSKEATKYVLATRTRSRSRTHATRSRTRYINHKAKKEEVTLSSARLSN